MRNLANHMLMMTVAMVSVSHMGMKMLGKLADVLDVPVPPLEKSEGRNERAAKPTMMTVIRTSLRDEDFFAPPVPCGISWPCSPLPP